MKGRKIIEIYLTEEERVNYLENMGNRTRYLDREYDHDEYAELINESFIWRDTNEDAEYWEDIFYRIESGVIMKEPIVPLKLMDKMEIK